MSNTSQIKISPCSAAATAPTAVVDPPEKPLTSKRKPESATSPNVPASSLDMAADDLESIGQEARWLARAAESIFCKLADGDELSDDELSVLRRTGPQVVPRDGGRSARAFERWKHAETSRILVVRKLQSKAGTGEDRQAASDAAEKAESKLTARSAEIAETVAKLEAERAELEQSAVKARADSDRRQTALSKLREKSVLPTYVADRIQQCKRRWSPDNGHRLESARQRLAVLAGLSALDVSERKMVLGGYSGGRDLDTVRSYVENCRALGHDPNSRLRSFGLLHETERPPYGRIVKVTPDGLSRAKWSAYLGGPVASEIETLHKQITALKVEETKHQEALAALGDHYVPS